MKFLLDESADYPLALFLKNLGHDVTAIAHDYPHALKDYEVLEIGRKEQRVVIANDRDFGELVFRRGLPHSGVILFRMGEEDLTAKQKRLRYVLETHQEDLSEFIVITESNIRIRKSSYPV